jgi:hypothetical protein
MWRTVDVEIARQICMHNYRFTELPFLQNLDDCLRKRLKPGPHCFHKENAVLFGSSKESAQLGGIGGDRLFTQYMLLGADRIERVRIMVCVRRSCSK